MNVRLTLIIVALAMMMPSSTFAQNWCDQLVYDEVGALGDRYTLVEAKAAELAQLGVEVRVRITDTSHTTADGSAYQQHLQNQCSSWRSEQGGRKENLLSILVIMDGNGSTSWIYYGRDWKQPLDSTWSEIRTTYMSPQFRQRNWSGGLEAGLTQLTATIRSYQAPQPISQETARMSTGWIIFWVIAAIVVVGIILIGIGASSSSSKATPRSPYRPPSSPGPSSSYYHRSSSSTRGSGSGGSSRRRQSDSGSSDGGSTFIFWDSGSPGGSSGYSGGDSGGGDSGGGGGGGDGGGGGGGGGD